MECEIDTAGTRPSHQVYRGMARPPAAGTCNPFGHGCRAASAGSAPSPNVCLRLGETYGMAPSHGSGSAGMTGYVHPVLGAPGAVEAVPSRPVPLLSRLGNARHVFPPCSVAPGC